MTGHRSGPSEKHSLILPVLAAGLFIPLFVFKSTGPLDFWASLSLSVVFLSAAALGLDRAYFPLLRRDVRTRPGYKIILGILSAIALYAVFMAGNFVLRRIFPAAGLGISRVYDFGARVSRLRIGLLMFFFIGPGEELFWRGYLQRAWQSRFSDAGGWLLTSLFYAAVHIGSGNPVLVLAAMGCGLYWGYLFRRYRSPLLLCVSHTLWDLMVFVVLPFS